MIQRLLFLYKILLGYMTKLEWALEIRMFDVNFLDLVAALG